jgi:hypothetical protein
MDALPLYLAMYACEVSLYKVSLHYGGYCTGARIYSKVLLWVLSVNVFRFNQKKQDLVDDKPPTSLDFRGILLVIMVANAAASVVAEYIITPLVIGLWGRVQSWRSRRKEPEAETVAFARLTSGEWQEKDLRSTVWQTSWEDMCKSWLIMDDPRRIPRGLVTTWLS